MSEREPSLHRFGETESENKSDNILLRSPQTITPEEVRLDDKESSFSRENTKKYLLGSRHGQSYFVVEYYGSLPAELTPDEKKLFKHEQRQSSGAEKDAYILEYGNVPERTAKEKESGTKLPDGYHIMPPRQFTDYQLENSQHLSPSDLAI